MTITEQVTQNEGPAEGTVNKSDPGVRQSFSAEQLPTIGQGIQKDRHEIDFEHRSRISSRDIFVSSLVLLSFAALLVFVYMIHPS